MMTKILTLLFVFILLSANTKGRDWSLSGYISAMPSVIVLQPENEIWWQALTHNRINFGWQINEHLRFNAGLRNRFIVGSREMISPEIFDTDAGLMDLSWNWFSANTGQNSLLLNSTFDRLNISFEKNRWRLQLGRQRINWGQTFVWNPNDIFNTHSFFDFDYPERLGCDAIRGTFFHSGTSSSEIAVSLNRNKEITAALLHRWNNNNVDYQLITGVLTESDIVVGGAITSDLGGLNLRSEFSYFHPINRFADTLGIIAISAGIDYVFANSLMLQAEVLYNNVSSDNSAGLMAMHAAPLSAKNLSICRWNIFVNASYSITPRLNAALSGMYFVDIDSFYAGISLDYSIIENLDFSFITQYFFSFGNSGIGNTNILMGFARLRYSF